MDEYERQIRQRLKDDFPHYAKKCLKIRAKDGEIQPFTLNKAQLYIHEKLEEQLASMGRVRAMILKGRQQGCSTYVGARFYHKVTHNFGTQAFILTHLEEATGNLYTMARRYYEHTPETVKPAVAKSNAKELVFGKLDSGYKLGTAKNKAVGRSATIQLLHGSEVAFWTHASDHATGILQAIPNAPRTEIILESTADGVGNYFHQEWQKAERGISEFIPIFIPWFWQEEYRATRPKDFVLTAEEADLQQLYGLTDEQLTWRRNKIIGLTVNGADGEKAFKQEYPNHASEAFQLTGEDAYIESDIIMAARKDKEAEKYGPLIIACDPARMGDDRTAILKRQGRVAYDLETYTKKDTMEVVGILQMLIQKYKPAKVMIDIGGLGAGIVDRLHELEHKKLVIGVNAGSKPYDGVKYKNKRAEMWATCKEWLYDEPCKIPDDEALHADLAGIKYKFDSNSRLVMESKEDMKKRGIRSSDCADALCLTFALPMSAIMATEEKDEIAEALNSHFKTRMKAIRERR